jgi:hypothetical protein
MSQAGYTPIQLYFSTTAAAVPVNTNLANGELAINITDEKLYFKNAAGVVKLLASNATSAPVLSFSAGTTGFTPSTATTGAVTLAGTLATTNGGTGLTSFTSGGVVYASSTSALATGSALYFSGTNLGIGTTSPATQLELYATSPVLRFSGDGSNAAGTLIGGTEFFNRDASVAGPNVAAFIKALSFQAVGAGAYLTFATSDGNEGEGASATEKMRLDQVGNLGLGVTPSAWDTSPYKAFQIGAGVGSASVIGRNDNVNGGGLALNAYYSSTGYRYIGSSFASLYLQVSGQHQFYTAPSGTAGNAITFTQAMTLDASGNLGIGTSSPTAIGASYGTIDIRGTSGGGINVGTTSTNTGAIYGNASGITIQANGATGTFFYTNSTERFRIAADGSWGLAGSNYGSSGQVLTSGGSGAAPTWTTVGGGGGSPATPTASGTVFGKTDSGGPYSALVGYQAGANLTTGAENVAMGWRALFTNVTGNYNVAIGEAALNQSTASNNVAVGYQAMYNNTTGTYNTAVGYGALFSNTTAGENSAFGFNALRTNTTGALNCAFGVESLLLNTTGSNNTAYGYQSLRSNTTGYNTTAFGYRALYSNTTGDTCAAFGHNTLFANTTGFYNVAVGPSALTSNTTGTYNNAFGYQALNSVTTGEHNCAFGWRSLYANTANQNSAFGHGTLQANTTGTKMTAVGNNALATNTTGTLNTAVGQEALVLNTTGSGNVAVGQGALRENTTASSNTAAGYLAGYNITSGERNTCIGREAGNYVTGITTGTKNVLVGSYAYVTAGAAIGRIVIGDQVGNGTDYRVVIGQDIGQVFNNYTVNATWTQASDGRLKNIVGSDTLGLSFINRLNPIKFTWKPQNELPTDNPHYREVNEKDTTTVIHGFIAQEVKAALDAENCNTFHGWEEDTNGIQVISREMFISPLVKAIQELSAQVETLKSEIATLKGA